ncbi:MAG: sugar phosphate isomerase/epimerase [Clostridia bacterium]|nr:sugar phosphate isomerase/epimerase [Clostridia bacterium]
MYEIGLSTCGKVICEDLFKMYQQSGITVMEISPAVDEYDDINYKKIKLWAEEYNIRLWSFHLPFAPFSEIDISKTDTCKKTIKYFEELIKKGADIGIEKCIIHSSGEPIEDNERLERIKYAKESLAGLAEFAKKNNAVIAVEDLPRTCLGRNSEEITELISVHDDLKVCFDTNHLLSENPVDFIKKTGNRIVTTHVSDYDFINERHWLPGEGKLDWQAVLQALKAVGYSGAWLYEISFSCPETIIRDRDLSCDDFVKNARELFENKPITVFSNPKDKFYM